jgi:hypothetical protein
MPTTTTKTVKSSGGDYTSLSGFEAGEQADLVAGDKILQAECYNFADSTSVSIDGWTTDATRYIRIYAEPTANRHAGVWSTSKARLSVASFADAIDIAEDYVRLEGLQIEETTDSQYNIHVIGTGTAANTDVRIDSCLIRRGGKNSVASVLMESGTTTITNCCVYGNTATSSSGIYGSTNTNNPTVNIYNCVVTACTAYGIRRVATCTMTVKNTYSGGHTTDAFNGTMTLTTCAHDTATSFTGSTANTAYATGSGAKFTSVTAGSQDFHITSGSALIDAGTDLSGTFTVDFEGATRTGTWDIGADEITGGGGGRTTKNTRAWPLGTEIGMNWRVEV